MSSQSAELLVGGLGLTVAKRILGKKAMNLMQNFFFAMMLVMHFADCGVLFGKLFNDFRVVD